MFEHGGLGTTTPNMLKSDLLMLQNFKSSFFGRDSSRSLPAGDEKETGKKNLVSNDDASV